jgi:hypothetical protein
MRLRSLLHPLGADLKEFVLSFFRFPSFPFLSFPFLSFPLFAPKNTKSGNPVRARLIVELFTDMLQNCP